jgi:hypothetical protein
MKAISMETIPNKSSKKSIENEAFWQQHYLVLKSSGLSRKEYCHENNLDYDQFGYRISKWNKVQAIDNNHERLVAVKLKPASFDESLNPSILCTLNFKSGHQLRVHDSKALMIILEKFY